jgi:2'-5' RNA ligase
VRLFIAINLPPVERGTIRNVTARARAAAPGASWVSEECLHLTLKFLGERPDTEVEGLRAALEGVARRSPPLRLSLGGVGAFPNFRAPRVVWMGVTHDPKLELLHHDMETVLSDLGYEVDGRPFRPHVTLARVRRELPRATAAELARQARTIDHRSTVDVHSVDLMASELLPSGPRYRIVGAARLGVS